MNKIPYFDGHCDTICRCLVNGEKLLRNTGHVDLERSSAFSAYAQVYAMFWDAAYPPAGGMLQGLKNMVKLYFEEIERNNSLVKHCCSVSDIETAVEAGKCAALLSIEGADLLECNPENIPLAAEWGVKLINPTWNRANVLSGSHCEDPALGLSDLGCSFIKEAERSGMMIDVSHLSERGFWDLVEIAERPIVASHSNSRSVFAHSRGLSDDQFRAICQSGGVAGLNFYSEFVGRPATMDALIRHLEHWLQIGGEDHVTLGADFDGCDTTVYGVDGIQDVPLLWSALAARGYSEVLLKKLFWSNWLRLM